MPLGRKAMTNLDSLLKSKNITLLTKVHIVKATVFPVVIYKRDSWTVKKSEHLELWCWRRLLRVPWTARSNQSLLKEINPEYSLEGLMLKLKLWPPDVKHWLIGRPWCWERLKAKGEGEGRGWDKLSSITDSLDKNLSKLQEIVKDRGVWCATVHMVKKSWTWLSNWITTLQNIPPGPLVKNLPSSARDTGSIPGRGIKVSHCGAIEPESSGYNWKTSTPQLLKPVCSTAHTLQQEKFVYCNEKLWCTTTRESPQATMKSSYATTKTQSSQTESK